MSHPDLPNVDALKEELREEILAAVRGLRLTTYDQSCDLTSAVMARIDASPLMPLATSAEKCINTFFKWRAT